MKVHLCHSYGVSSPQGGNQGAKGIITYDHASHSSNTKSLVEYAAQLKSFFDWVDTWISFHPKMHGLFPKSQNTANEWFFFMWRSENSKVKPCLVRKCIL